MDSPVVWFSFSMVAFFCGALIFIYPLSAALLFPFFYIFYNYSPGFGTIDLLLTTYTLFVVMAKNTVNCNNINQYQINKTLVGLFVILFAGAIVSTLNTPFEQHKAIYYTMTKLFSKAAIVYVIVNLINTEYDLQLCLKSMLLFIILALLTTAYFTFKFKNPFFMREGFFTGQGVIYESVLTHPNMLSRVLILFIPLVYIYSFFFKDRLFFHLVQTVCFCAMFIPLIGMSRAASVGLMGVMAILMFKKRKIVVMLMIMITLLSVVTSARIEERYAEVLTKGYALGKREVTAAASLESFKEHPFIGTGSRSILERLQKYGGHKFQRGGEIVYEYEHNSYLTALVEFGLLGLGLFIILLFNYIKYIIKIIRYDADPFTRNLLIGAVLGFSGFLITTFTGGDIYDNILWYQVGFTLALVKIASFRNVMARTV
jgi:O-antigen ligase